MKKKSGIVTARIPADLIESLDLIVSSEKVSRSKLIEEAIIDMLTVRSALKCK